MTKQEAQKAYGEAKAKLQAVVIAISDQQNKLITLQFSEVSASGTGDHGGGRAFTSKAESERKQNISKVQNELKSLDAAKEKALNAAAAAKKVLDSIKD